MTVYSLRGGQKLKFAVMGLKETYQRSVKKACNGTILRVLDTRENGVTLNKFFCDLVKGITNFNGARGGSK